MTLKFKLRTFLDQIFAFMGHLTHSLAYNMVFSCPYNILVLNKYQNLFTNFNEKMMKIDYWIDFSQMVD